MSNEIKTYRSTETVEAFVFEWPDDKPVRKGDMVNGMAVHMDREGAYLDVSNNGGRVGSGSIVYRQNSSGGWCYYKRPVDFLKRFEPVEQPPTPLKPD